MNLFFESKVNGLNHEERSLFGVNVDVWKSLSLGAQSEDLFHRLFEDLSAVKFEGFQGFFISKLLVVLEINEVVVSSFLNSNDSRLSYDRTIRVVRVCGEHLDEFVVVVG
jgi:hypothetical protein